MYFMFFCNIPQSVICLISSGCINVMNDEPKRQQIIPGKYFLYSHNILQIRYHVFPCFPIFSHIQLPSSLFVKQNIDKQAHIYPLYCKLFLFDLLHTIHTYYFYAQYTYLYLMPYYFQIFLPLDSKE